MDKLIASEHNIFTLDANYQRKNKAAIHLIVENQRAILIDSGVNSSFSQLNQGLNQLGLDLNSVDFLLLTHVHLDHAGGSGMIIKNCPNAKLVVHNRGARHMVNPGKLMAATMEVYGKKQTQELYGDLIPVPEERVIIANEGFLLNWQGREIIALDTPGHARHHLCYFDRTAQAIFSGDNLGLSYRELDISTEDNQPTHKFIFPATTPTHFEPEKLIDSIKRILGLEPKAAYLTHFGKIENLNQQAKYLIQHINHSVQIAQKYLGYESDIYNSIKQDLQKYFIGAAKKYGSNLSEIDILDVLYDDIELNAQGLTHWISNKK